MAMLAKQARLAIALSSVLVATGGLTVARHYTGGPADGLSASANTIHTDEGGHGWTISRPPRLPRSKPEHWA